MLNAALITIGDEILYGQTLDTNAHFISGEFSKAGIKIRLRLAVGDTEEDITRALHTAEASAEIIIMTGGLGPTRDDITKKTMAAYFNRELTMNDEALGYVEAFFKKRGIGLSEINRKQALMPEGSLLIRNMMGTASGIWIEKNEKIFISLPGVPHEMEFMIIQEVVPMIRKKFSTPVIYHKMIMTAGIGESWLSELISKWEDNLPLNMKLAYLPGYGQVKIRLTTIGEDLNEIKIQTEIEVKKLEPVAGKYIYGYDDTDLPQTVGEILKKRNETIAVAESCTGGHIAHTLTTIPGSSAYFMGGIIAYNNSIKMKWLSVSDKTIQQFGAVSPETVGEMALGVRNNLQTTYGLATSGIAGPGGGTPEKPVGLVYIAIADLSGVETRKFNFAKNRINNIRYSTVSALTFLWQRLMQKDG